MIYGSECWSGNKKTKQRLSVAEKRMIRSIRVVNLYESIDGVKVR